MRRPITAVPWDDLIGKWIVAESTIGENGGQLAKVDQFVQGKIFREIICCPLYVLNSGRVSVYNVNRMIVIQNEGWRYTVYDELKDMHDDVMLAFLRSKTHFPPIMLALEIPEFRKISGIDAGVFKVWSNRDARLHDRFSNAHEAT